MSIRKGQVWTAPNGSQILLTSADRDSVEGREITASGTGLSRPGSGETVNIPTPDLANMRLTLDA
ncbi:hypothetical protein ACFV3R_25515 [Streptomyces sp. NPDC059740]|uniref:hypothetical protein n=1 Tax=Streptomyces sp. NPDC059740 TaxID=3346926 RepID=UPI0036490363